MTQETDIDFTSAPESREFLQQELDKKNHQLQALTLESDPLKRASLQHDVAEIMLEIAEPGMKDAAWGLSKEAFNIYVEHEQYEDAVRCTDTLYRADMENSIHALGNGLWLSVTYPIDPELTIVMLNNLIDDTPNNSDGAAVAAATAHYIADLRLQDDKRESTMYLTSGILSKVAQRHSGIDNQDAMTMWMHRLELLDPATFLPRLGLILDAIVDNNWWYDRDELRKRLPVH